MNTFVKNNSLLISKKLELGPTPAGGNSANYNGVAGWNGLDDGNVTSVGSNGGPSAYNTFDMSGNTWEWNDLNGASGSSRGLRGGSWNNLASSVSSASRLSYAPSFEYFTFGFRLASSSSALNPLNLSNFVVVADANNVADTNGYGSVNTNYLIGKYSVTNCEYALFLNSVDPQGINPQGLYNPNMNNNVMGGISLISGNANGSKYVTKPNISNKPVLFVNWFDCARYCNWLHNGKLTYSTTDSTATAPQNTGAYNLGTATTGNAVTKESNAAYHIPTENEWYKAAYYKGGSTNAGYWLYATQSNTAPTPVTASSTGDGLISGVPANVSSYVCP
jgi:formylglycine-generating enzyme required for sulfatase activity